LALVRIDRQLNNPKRHQHLWQFSHAEAKAAFSSMIVDEITNSQDNKNVEDGIKKFMNGCCQEN